jgi:hypothetical protein
MNSITQFHQSSPFFNPQLTQQDCPGPWPSKEPKPAESVSETETEAPEPTEAPEAMPEATEAVPEATEEVNVEPKDEGAFFLGKTTPWIWGKLAVLFGESWVKVVDTEIFCLTDAG